MKSLRISLITAAVAILSLGQPELIGYLKSSTNEVKLNSSEEEIRDSSEIAKIAKEITVRLEGAGSQGSGVIVKKEVNRYTILTSWHVVKDLSLIHI